VKILIIQTGGTIDKDYPKTTNGYAFEIDQPAVLRVLEQVAPGFEYECIELMKKDSLDITEADRKLLRKTIISAEATKILITHGSDTMPETASFLNSIQGKTIVLTGAYRPERFANSDAAFNIGVAIGSLNTLEQGTFIAMNGLVFPANRVRKNSVTGKFEYQ
jgi:L-asparaginase|tara:strand:+ start:6581 stop:7069 length:489 start_codon:yes stop_codon:yes gene_type:complete